MKRFLIPLAALALSGCVVGPNYVSPAPHQPAQAGFVSAASPAFVPAEPPADWWRLYDAPILDRLVAEALAANTDLRVAAANLRQAQAALRETRTARLPTTQINAGAGYGRTVGPTQSNNGTVSEGTTYSDGFEL